jgi:hypothetical protein
LRKVEGILYQGYYCNGLSASIEVTLYLHFSAWILMALKKVFDGFNLGK